MKIPAPEKLAPTEDPAKKEDKLPDCQLYE